VLFVLVEPLVALLRQKLVSPEGSVDEPVDERRGQVLPGRINLTGSRSEWSLVLEMRLVDVFGRLGLEDVEFPAQGEEVGVEMTVGHDLHQIVEVVRLLVHFHKVLLATEHESELLLHEQIILSTREKDVLHELGVVELHGTAHRFRETRELPVDAAGSLQQLRVFRLWDVVDARD